MTRLDSREITVPYAWRSTREISSAASWRSQRPILELDKCTGCMVCWKFCPEPAIIPDGKKVRFDLSACKGCGVCEETCAPRAIHMETEGL
ncbi:MAG: 4Fe-4S binding protein [Euryarchaeota archaeon]|nr:4Fe-4S binding protein [Euryarchaeota archaeon]MDE1835086.1 4Fe-4S binding protein [Euryarchaeota archaeon]MDE1879358.1 4Fe-4S binding protein [Euryarchaeota archaeon]MDE2044951.1 4Fe-4S binding protein [Thermoplasmata archaeon]